MSILLFFWTFVALLPAVPPILTLKSFHTDPADISDIFESFSNDLNFMTANHKICPKFGKDTKLLLAVISAPSHKDHRRHIRRTWGHFSTRKDVSLMFLIGSSSDKSHNRYIDVENDLYDDVIRVNFQDSYDNLTLKTISMLMWADDYCPKASFVLKIEDDVYLNVDRLLNYIEKLDPKERSIHGWVESWKPNRNPKSQNYISYQQYQSDEAIKFAKSPAYLLPQQIIKELYEEALNYKYIQIEDVFITGIVRNKLKIELIFNVEFFVADKNRKSCAAAQDLISIHNVIDYDLFDMWRKLHRPKINCK